MTISHNKHAAAVIAVSFSIVMLANMLDSADSKREMEISMSSRERQNSKTILQIFSHNRTARRRRIPKFA
jgi:hypothetical protein